MSQPSFDLEERLLEVVASLEEANPRLHQALKAAIDQRDTVAMVPPSLAHAPIDPLVPPQQAGRPLATFIMGAGNGAIARALRDGARTLEHPPPITVVETDPVRMLHSLLQNDWSDLFADPTVRFAVGTPLITTIEAALPEARDPMLEFDHGLAVVDGEDSEHARSIRTAFETAARDARNRFTARCEEQVRARGTTPALKEGPWRIAMATSSATSALKHLAASMIEAANGSGHDARLLLKNHLKEPFLASNHMQWAFDADPDLCLSLLRPGAMVAPWRGDYPSLVLVSSFPHLLELQQFPWSDRELIVVTDPGFATSYRSLGLEPRVRSLASDIPSEDACAGGVVCDVVIVGNLPDARSVVPELDEGALQRIQGEARDLLKDPSALIDLPKNQHELALAYEATALRRQQAAIALAQAGFSVRIHGGEEWRKRIASTAAETAYHGPLDAVTQQPAAFNAAAVAINVNSFATPGMLNMRSFDIPAAGGVLVSDARPALHDAFDVGSEALAFNTIEELTDQVAEILRDRDARNAIAAAGQARIKREHTWQHFWAWAEAELRARFAG